VAQLGTADDPDLQDTKLWTPRAHEEMFPATPPANQGNNLLVLSTATLPTADQAGVLTLAPGAQALAGDNANDDAPGLPPPLSALPGSNGGAGGTPFDNCDGVNDCSDAWWPYWGVAGWDEPHDAIWMQADIQGAYGKNGFRMDVAFFTSEYPDRMDTAFNDTAVIWVSSTVYTGNVLFFDGYPVTASAVNEAGYPLVGDAPELAGTGFEGHAGTGWFVAKGSAEPEETFEVVFFIADMGDSILATGVLLDNFRWDCAGCVPDEVNSCGIQPQ
jgi:hypothetical protein